MEFVDNITPSWDSYRLNTRNVISRVTDNYGDQYRDYMTMYVPNALQAAMLNYQNEYNSPLNQLLRYQEAGVSPWMALQQPSTSASPGSVSGPGSKAPTQTERLKSMISSVSNIASAIATGANIYDYIQYGAKQSELNTDILYNRRSQSQYDAARALAESDWAQYWNYGEGFGPNSVYVEGSPRKRYMEASTALKEQQFAQISSMIDTLYPSQKEANEARAALAQYQKEVLEGRTDAVLQLNTGNQTVDAILKTIIFAMMNKFGGM